MGGPQLGRCVWGYMGVPERCGVKIGAGCGWLLWKGLNGSVLVDREGYTRVPVGVVQVVHGGGTHDAMEYNSSVCTNKQSE